MVSMVQTAVPGAGFLDSRPVDGRLGLPLPPPPKDGAKDRTGHSHHGVSHSLHPHYDSLGILATVLC